MILKFKEKCFYNSPLKINFLNFSQFIVDICVILLQSFYNFQDTAS
jgi:hypothetical protein